MSRVVYSESQDTVEQAELRRSHRVRLVTEAEEGTSLGALPAGVYGFSYSPGLPNTPLFAVRRYRSYEIHKLAAGEVLVIGFADAETAQAIASGQEGTIRVQPVPTGDLDRLVQIPYARIRQHRQYAAPNQDGFLVTLAAPVATGRA